MIDRFKNIPITSTNADASHGEIKSCAEAEPYALRVLGDSMAPEFIEGHILIVDPAMAPQHGAYVIIDYQGETTFRQYVVVDGRRYLKPLNDAYPTVELVDKYTVRGVVVQRASRRRKDHKNYY